MIIKFPTEKDIGALKSLWREAFCDSDEYIDTFFRVAFSPERCRIAFLDGKLAGALYWFDCEYDGRRVAYLYAVATSKEHRGRGICRALMENTREHLEGLGYTQALLVPGEEGLFDMYSRLGYSVCSEVSEFTAYPSGRVAKIREITPDEYMSLRRQMLPEGSVVQEGGNIAFLCSLYKLYAGEGVLFAAKKVVDRLICTELLGDALSAPDILASFGCSEGEFRTPGTGRKFAMHRILCDTPTALPSYFGLAFD